MKRSLWVKTYGRRIIDVRILLLMIAFLILASVAGVNTSPSRSSARARVSPESYLASFGPTFTVNADPCVSITNCPANQDVLNGTPINLTAVVPRGLNPGYSWTFTDSNGQDRSNRLHPRNKAEVSIDTGQLRGVHTARVEVSGFQSNCAPRDNSCQFIIVSGPPPCPSLKIDCPSEVEQGKTIEFTVSGTGSGATFNWSISAGTISKGQSTKSIKVKTARLPIDSTITATVSVGGMDPGCFGTTTSCTTQIMQKRRKD